MSKTNVVERVVREVSEMLRPDCDAELIEVKDGVVTIRYLKGTNPNCIDCVMDPGDLRAYFTEMLRPQFPELAEVKIETVLLPVA
jgi:Fe-S cluster biogenesis protein NfuA